MAELVEVTALATEDLRRMARIKPLSEGVSLSSVIRDFMVHWMENGRKTIVERPGSPEQHNWRASGARPVGSPVVRASWSRMTGCLRRTTPLRH